jgi:hypothetical protein
MHEDPEFNKIQFAYRRNVRWSWLCYQSIFIPLAEHE